MLYAPRMNERVDKQWRNKGLTEYSVSAILGTLTHYGVALDEAAFRTSADGRFPLELAVQWKPHWKGTGQFAAFPYAAANELFNRLLPHSPTPIKTAHVVLDVIAHALKLESKLADADFAKAIAGWEELVPKLPPKGERRDIFMEELVSVLESWAQTFNELPERLAKSGNKDAALKLAHVHELLFPDREGCMTAVVRAHTGEREAAVADLTTWAADKTRDVFARYSALDSLYQLEAYEGIKAHGLVVFDEAAAQGKWGLADAVAHLLGHLTQKTEVDGTFVRDVRARLDRAHAHTGGHHH